MTIRKGATYKAFWKQKLNTKISTESKLVAVHNAMLQVLWTRDFLEVQVQHVASTTIYQDNKSTIILGRCPRKVATNRP